MQIPMHSLEVQRSLQIGAWSDPTPDALHDPPIDRYLRGQAREEYDRC